MSTRIELTPRPDGVEVVIDGAESVMIAPGASLAVHTWQGATLVHISSVPPPSVPNPEDEVVSAAEAPHSETEPAGRVEAPAP